MLCPNCKKEISDSSHFCSNCGKDILNNLDNVGKNMILCCPYCMSCELHDAQNKKTVQTISPILETSLVISPILLATALVAKTMLSNTDKVKIECTKCGKTFDRSKAICLDIEKVKKLEQINDQPLKNKNIRSMKNKKVFIVHGHDEAAKESTARFLEKFDLTAIILHEQANKGKTIIEKIEECSDVCFGIVLYTPCDKGGENKKRAVLKERARQNVIFEHGYLISKLGRDRVCALVKGDVEVPGDIAGIVYIKMDEAGAWKTKIAKEMLENKIDIDPQKLVS